MVIQKDKVEKLSLEFKSVREICYRPHCWVSSDPREPACFSSRVFDFMFFLRLDATAEIQTWAGNIHESRLDWNAAEFVE